jgi:hypothetical protein
LLLSVDLEPDALQHGGPEPELLDHLRRRLIDLLGTHAAPATWAVADPIRSVATDSLLAAGSGHEIAVLGDRAWLGPGSGRLRLERELVRRFDGARKAGIPVTTLALRNLDSSRAGPAADHGITALRGPATDSQPAADQPTPPIRFGIWQAPPGCKVPGRSSWWLPAAWSLCRQIKRSTARQSIVHLHIDAPRLAASGEYELQMLSRVLRYAAARQLATLIR